MPVVRYMPLILVLAVSTSACTLTMGPEQVAASYIELILMGDDRAAIGLLESGCPVVHKTGFSSAESVIGTVDAATEAGVTVQVRIRGTLANGQFSDSSSKLNVVKQDALWVVKCPVTPTPTVRR